MCLDEMEGVETGKPIKETVVLLSQLFSPAADENTESNALKETHMCSHKKKYLSYLQNFCWTPNRNFVEKLQTMRSKLSRDLKQKRCEDLKQKREQTSRWTVKGD